MNYGFIVWFEDLRGYKFKYYSIFSSSEGEAEKDFILESLERNYSNLKIRSIDRATEFDWMNYEIHGDAWHSPNAKKRA